MRNLIVAIALTLLTLMASASFANTKSSTTLNKADAAEQRIQKLNINQASLQQLEAIPGLGKSKAQAVLDYIAKNGAIKNSNELTNVKGIGNKLAAKISPYISYN
ncbi:ComEA family DNA-binding protein [Rheinheimera sp. MMS21-TC3]|uniref:ComEA family DNA-binding protein n=1 Tax=Rheinheimera sp. MMS21-TC3 TaxID=3072790 RepID=UPI0028C3B5D2|nr:helix-hairpin-helix domain-containing protein [Rheinheimera sp. MMS21-TC3]WNO60711.1 helix-hairpin-helix domain-containing protein [Rheinheimera sp. MMS21-TC3]